MVLQGCKSTPQKSRPIESGHGRHAVQVAIEHSYKLGQKMNQIKFWCELGWFLHGQSQMKLRLYRLEYCDAGCSPPLSLYSTGCYFIDRSASPEDDESAQISLYNSVPDVIETADNP